MNMLAFLAAAALASTPQAHSSAQPAPAVQTNAGVASPSLTEQLIEIIELEEERYRRLTVPVKIMGEGPFRFIIDTGAQATVISQDLADQLQLDERQTATLVGMNSVMPVEIAALPEVSVGNRSFSIDRAPLVEAENIGIADGILGIDGLQGSRVLLDFENNQISVVEEIEKRSGYEIVVRARRRVGQLIIASAKVDGVRVAVVVDTGAQHSIGNPELLRRLRRAKDLGDGQMTDINGIASTGAIRMARSLQIDRARLTNLPIVFSDSPSFHALGLDDKPALLLGMSELRLFDRVAIDFKTREVLFDLPREHDWPNLARN